MCDQDHFEEDRKEYEARGLVTRKQFGAMLGAGIAMMLTRLGGLLLIAAAAMRGLSVHRPPLGNMFEFALVGCMFVIVVFVAIASMAPDATMAWPIIDLVELIRTLRA